jgi:hypothetical protein
VVVVDQSTAPISATPAVEESTGASEGPVILDIGGAVGAVVIVTGADLDGTEVEVRPLGTEWDGTHVAVRSRPTAGEPVYAAVFSQLHEGVHEFRRRPTQPGQSVHRIKVVGGGVVEFHWRG